LVNATLGSSVKHMLQVFSRKASGSAFDGKMIDTYAEATSMLCDDRIPPVPLAVD
jgi:hypothetical protein